MNLTLPAPLPASTADSPAPHANPWAQLALAWVNGTTLFPPLRAVPVRKRRPRTMYIVLGKPNR